MPLLERREWFGGAARIEHLKAISLFAEVKDQGDVLASLASLMEEKRYHPGDAIIREGDHGDEMYLLIEGSASVFKSTPDGDEYKVAILEGKNHSFFGEGALLDADARSATIRANSPCLCLVLSKKSFDAFGTRRPEAVLPILRRIARAVMARLKKSNQDLMLLYHALIEEIRGQ